jgi:hypothetical protein
MYSTSNSGISLDAHLEQMHLQRTAQLELGTHQERRAAAAAAREEHLRERERLEIKHLRESQVLDVGVLRLSRNIGRIERELGAKELELEQGAAAASAAAATAAENAAAEAASAIKDARTPAPRRGEALDRLERELDDLRRAHAALIAERDAARAETVAGEDEHRAAVAELDERCDALAAQIDYHDALIARKAEVLRRENPQLAIERLIERVATMDRFVCFFFFFFLKICLVIHVPGHPNNALFP